ncbi:hypothetical protein [Silvanigrella sp.]|jgi:hypothetical protein|uniref:hypothetical protein n=1 Tax=Silvanigrella sp. TaxID=2024976 RepID=UPI0037CCBBDA|nr:hypothetical protein [Silvanigrellaceae bacterium]
MSILSKIYFLFIILTSIFSFAYVHAYEKEKFDLIVDTDLAIDDWVALLYTLNQKKTI